MQEEKKHRSASSEGPKLEGGLEGKSMTPPAFSLSASPVAPPNDMKGRLTAGGEGVTTQETAAGPLTLGTLENAAIGAGAGAAIGAGVGSFIPGIGTAIGAGVGALVGGVAGALTGNGPSLSHTAIALAPDGTGKDRKRVGVGESVIFKSDTDGAWTATAGTPGVQANGKMFIWKAPERAATAKISIKAGDKTTSVDFEVVEPQRISTKKVDEIPYAAGTAGAGMHLYFDYHPMSVSFANIEAGEVSGPASNITGYFATQYTAANLHHHSGDGLFALGAKNRLNGQDTAAGSGMPQPWSVGGFHWLIPNRFQVAGGTSGTKEFFTMTQAFTIAADGTMSVTKGEESVTRTP